MCSRTCCTWTLSNIRWLDSRWDGLTVAMMLGIWKGVGWNLVVFLAALQSVPQSFRMNRRSTAA